MNHIVKTIVSHNSCPDGLASAMIAASVYPDASVIFLAYNTPAWRELAADDGMLFVDMSPPPERVSEFVAVGSVVLDHHASQAEMVKSMPLGVFDNERCGALLALEELDAPDDDRSTEFALLADTRDRWLKDSDDWREACAQASALMFFDRDVLLAQARKGQPWLSLEQHTVGRLLEAKRERDATVAADKAMLMRNGKVAFVNDTAGIISDAAEVLRGRGVHLVVGFRLSQGERGIRCDYSLRSDDSFDCAAFCKRHGGGGHARAAGFNRDTSNPIGDFLSLLI